MILGDGLACRPARDFLSTALGSLTNACASSLMGKGAPGNRRLALPSAHLGPLPGAGLMGLAAVPCAAAQSEVSLEVSLAAYRCARRGLLLSDPAETSGFAPAR
jgi:hypothetical protein